MPTGLRPTHAHVQLHTGELFENTGIWILVAGGAPLISVPVGAWSAISSIARTWSSTMVGDSAALRCELERCEIGNIEKIVGPAFIGYGSSTTLKLEEEDSVRQLGTADQDAVSALRAACSSEEWEHGGSDDATAPRFGVFDSQGQLAALASYEIWNGNIAHISIVSDPKHRGRGLARRAVATAARHALRCKLLPQYRTLRENGPSMRIAERLGFSEYGFSVYVRLRAA